MRTRAVLCGQRLRRRFAPASPGQTGTSSPSTALETSLPIATRFGHQRLPTRRRAVDRYRIERKLGEGGMANVYLAHDLKHDRPVAIKALKPELASALGGERFLAEIRMTAKLSHPRILQLIDSGNANGVLYYVMPFVDGESLRARMDREEQLGVDAALEITRQIADALQHAHARGIIHRDIKPENILLEYGHVLVADFGVARAITRGRRCSHHSNRHRRRDTDVHESRAIDRRE
jgi:serine/threonine protein kinase